MERKEKTFGATKLTIVGTRISLVGPVACRKGWLGWSRNPRTTGVQICSLYGGGHSILKLVLKDNYAWGCGGIQSRSFIVVGPGHSQVAVRTGLDKNFGKTRAVGHPVHMSFP